MKKHPNTLHNMFLLNILVRMQLKPFIYIKDYLFYFYYLLLFVIIKYTKIYLLLKKKKKQSKKIYI